MFVSFLSYILFKCIVSFFIFRMRFKMANILIFDFFFLSLTLSLFLFHYWLEIDMRRTKQKSNTIPRETFKCQFSIDPHYVSPHLR